MIRTIFFVFLSFGLFVPPYGSAETPASGKRSLVVLFQKQKDPAKMKVEAQKMADALAKALGQKVEAHVPTDYAASVQGIVSGTADVAYVDSMSAILAERDGGASIILAEERPDTNGVTRTEYDSVFVARKDSEVKNFEDIKRNAKKLSMVFTSPTSTSGFVFPSKRLVDEGMLPRGGDPKSIFANVAFAGSYAQALEQVAKGLGDVAAVSNYAIEGGSKHVSPEVAEKLQIVGRTPGVPTHVVIVAKSLSPEKRESVRKALLSIASEQPGLLSDIYGAASFVKVDPVKHVKASRDALELTNIPNPAAKKK